MPILENADPLEPRLDPDTGGAASETGSAAPDDGSAKSGDGQKFDDSELLNFLGQTKRLSRTYQQNVTMTEWEQSQSAYRSQHAAGSKYKKDQYKNRAKYFKPKTRSAVRKNLTATANAMFSSRDVMSCSAEDDGDPNQLANAALLKELIDSRFNSKSVRNGVPWFQIAIGARFDTQVMGVVCSKQTWTYKAADVKQIKREERPLMFGAEPMLDAETGQPMIEVVQTEVMVKDVQKDKPEITLIPGEMVLLDPSAPWIDPAQNSPTLIVIWPMHVDDVRAMMDAEKNTTPWRKVSDEALRGAYYSETEILGLKSARDGGAQAAIQKNTATFGGNRNEIVETWECFFRRDDTDYHCWSLKGQALLSDAVPTIQSYPAHRGTRPIVIGTDALEPHVLYPESHVASWKHAQDEINDFSNLRMDASRQAVFPTAKVVAGKNIDYKSVQRRDGQGIILVREPNDVTWDRPPGPPPNVHEEVNLLSNDFDELAGIFSQTSVQSNRQTGGTVGGMQLISANANATSEFDLRTFITTWAEPVLSQIVALEQYYEDDATLLAIAGEKGKLFQRFGVDTITDELLESQVTIEMDIGIGNSDPMQQLAKFKTVFDIATPIIQLGMQQGKVTLQFEEIFSEIFGKAGYRNGGDRFITVDPNGTAPADPAAADKMKQALEQAQQQIQDLTTQLKSKAAQIQSDQQVKATQIASNHENRQAEIAQSGQSAMQVALVGLLRDTLVARIAAKEPNEGAALDARVEMLLKLISTGALATLAPPAAPPAPVPAPQLSPQPAPAPMAAPAVLQAPPMPMAAAPSPAGAM